MMQKILLIFLLAGTGVLPNLANAQETNAAAAVSQTNAAPVTATDWNSFKILSQRNIFNPNRRVRRTTTPVVTPRRRVDSFTLVGTMSYEKGTFAFFDGSSSEYRKTLKPSDTIAGYRIAQIEPDYVSLAGASNKLIRLPVGVQIRRPEGGRWALAGQADSSSDSPDSAAANSDTPPAPGADAAPASAAESDIIKRMMAKRLSEK